MVNSSNVLIVEDEDDWSAIYERTARREGVSTVKVAKTFKEAERLIQVMEFAVAFIDVGLDVGDDRNIDGLRVMEKIRAVGDETSIIVVTGRSGRDVLPITRDAIMKYHAYDAVGKVPLEPADLRRLMKDGMGAYNKIASSKRPAVYHVLSGELPSWKWADQVMRFTRIRGGADAFYHFLDRLFARFLPVVTSKEGAGVRVQEQNAYACGIFWSRAVGHAVAVFLKPNGEIDNEIEEAQLRATVADEIGDVEIGDLLHTESAGAVHGAVFALNNVKRESFPLI